MSLVTSTVTSCPSLQASLNQYFETCNIAGFHSPLTEFLTSSVNTSGIQQVVSPASNKKRTAQLIYDQPIWVDEASSKADCTKNCTATTERGDLYADYTIDCTDGLYMEELVDTSNWMESCRNNNDVIASHLNKLIIGLEDAIAQKTAQELPPLVGAWSTDVPTSGMTVNADDFLEVKTELDSSDSINPKAFENVDMALMQTGYCNGQFITGGSDLYQYWRYLQAGCCANEGIDAGEILRLYGRSVTYDRWVAAEFGNDVSVAIQPRSLQLLNLTTVDPSLVGDIGIANLDFSYRNYYETVIVSPRYGIPMDLRIKDDCGTGISIHVECITKLVGLPLDIFPPNNPLAGVTFVNGIQVANV